MFLRWTKYRDKRGRVRLYARLISSWREGGRVRHKSDGSLRVCIQAGVNWSADHTRQTWAHLDYVLARYRLSATERENIERAFAAQVGERPPPTALENLWTKLARKMHRLGRISCKVLIFRGIKFATQISAAFAEPHRP